MSSQVPSPVRCAAIMAGGRSTRMGRDKALLSFEGETLVRRAARVLEPLFERVIVVTNSHEVARAAGIPVVPDAHFEKGPLAGIEAGLSALASATFVVACDAPYLHTELIRFQCSLWEEALDALVAQSDNGVEPLHAVWAPSALPAIRSALQQERTPSLRRVLDGLSVRTLPVAEARRFDPLLRCFENWNTPEDVAAAG